MAKGAKFPTNPAAGHKPGKYFSALKSTTYRPGSPKSFTSPVKLESRTTPCPGGRHGVPRRRGQFPLASPCVCQNTVAPIKNFCSQDRSKHRIRRSVRMAGRFNCYTKNRRPAPPVGGLTRPAELRA